MAEEALVKEPLTAEMIQAGEELTRRLDDSGWPLVASLWLFESDQNEWKLLLASPAVSSGGPKAVYDAVAQALTELQQPLTSLNYISVVAPDHPLVRLLAAAASTSPRISGRFSKTMIGGRFIADAYLYRVMPTAA